MVTKQRSALNANYLTIRLKYKVQEIQPPVFLAPAEAIDCIRRAIRTKGDFGGRTSERTNKRTDGRTDGQQGVRNLMKK